MVCIDDYERKLRGMMKTVELREMTSGDYDDFINLKLETSFFVKGFFENEKRREIKWKEMMQPERRNYVINKEGVFCGYCAIKNINKEKPEIEIELLKEFQGKGIGFQALLEMMWEISMEYDKQYFIAVVEQRNIPSQRLMLKLGGTHSGMKKSAMAKYFESYLEDEKNNPKLLSYIHGWIEELARGRNKLPEDIFVEDLVFEFSIDELKKLILAWDEDFTKLTFQERMELEQTKKEMENGEYFLHNEINWN